MKTLVNNFNARLNLDESNKVELEGKDRRTYSEWYFIGTKTEASSSAKKFIF
jgi:hypothetical protein